VLVGEITSAARVNVEAVAREAIKEIGYNDPDRRFNPAGVSVLNLFSRQAADIACNGNDLGVDGQLCRPECR
jgi:S-adenosylmethionine synthetase